ncbi:hypothetical protein N7493_005023 [Penicillium malachiteum]|uniref:Uncharacterized protein n=1 Tax=Penicillium malachiteum TaxID=1324776 RepID=A0AAD6HLW8_9EURO|nr:hypothetical protein N7493_005023 [Penicillium malachiteum]
MPSVSTLSQVTFSNLGPLTTTFTAPSSCSTMGETGVAYRSLPNAMLWNIDCSINPKDPAPSWDCYPEGTAPSPTATLANPDEILQASYFSPGLFCPSGWKTVGEAVRDGSSISSNGAFSYYTTPLPSVVQEAFPDPMNVLMEALADGETAALCCPSYMTGATNIGCYSTLPSYTVSEGCAWKIPFTDFALASETYTFDGVPVSGLVESLVATSPMTQILSESIPATEATSYIGITVEPMVILVHKEQDLKDSTATATSNAAVRLGWSGVGDRDMGLVLLVSMMGMLLGTLIIIPF